MILSVRLALGAWLSAEAAGMASCLQQWSHWGWKEGGGTWAGCSYQGCCLTACEGSTPWAPLLPLSPAKPALAERKGIGLVSLLPRPQGAFLLEYI